MLFSSHHDNSTQYQGFITVDVDLDCLAEAMFGRYLHCEIMFCLLSVLFSLEGSPSVQLTLKDWGAMLHLHEERAEWYSLSMPTTLFQYGPSAMPRKR